MRFAMKPRKVLRSDKRLASIAAVCACPMATQYSSICAGHGATGNLLIAFEGGLKKGVLPTQNDKNMILILTCTMKRLGFFLADSALIYCGFKDNDVMF